MFCSRWTHKKKLFYKKELLELHKQSSGAEQYCQSDFNIQINIFAKKIFSRNLVQTIPHSPAGPSTAVNEQIQVTLNSGGFQNDSSDFDRSDNDWSFDPDDEYKSQRKKWWPLLLWKV